jgi:cysteine desulfurase
MASSPTPNTLNSVGYNERVMPQSATPIYMDNHSTTRVDPRVVEAMLPYMTESYGNAGSVNHSFGWDAKDAVDAARATVADCLGAHEKEIVFTSGATEGNNLAIFGVTDSPRRRGDHLLSVTTEHKAVLDPLARLKRRGFEVTLLDVAQGGNAWAGVVDLDAVDAAIRDDTCLVSVMLANNEIGTIQPIAEIGRICKERGVLLHCDATQAVGKIPVDVEQLQVDLMSLSAHKMYGPKGIGALYVRRRNPRVRLEPQIVGGGQESGRRSGTLAVPSLVALAKSVELACDEMTEESQRVRELRDRLFAGLTTAISDVELNGPELTDTDLRLAGNLNLSFAGVDGEALLMSVQDVALSSGSACTSADPEPSHVLRALGLSDDLTRCSIRFGLGHFNTAEEVERVIEMIAEAVERLRAMSGTG